MYYNSNWHIAGVLKLLILLYINYSLTYIASLFICAVGHFERDILSLRDMF